MSSQVHHVVTWILWDSANIKQDCLFCEEPATVAACDAKDGFSASIRCCEACKYDAEKMCSDMMHAMTGQGRATDREAK